MGPPNGAKTPEDGLARGSLERPSRAMMVGNTFRADPHSYPGKTYVWPSENMDRGVLRVAKSSQVGRKSRSRGQSRRHSSRQVVPSRSRNAIEGPCEAPSCAKSLEKVARGGQSRCQSGRQVEPSRSRRSIEGPIEAPSRGKSIELVARGGWQVGEARRSGVRKLSGTQTPLT